MNRSNRNIDFFVVGAQKCATTWIHHCLNEHPDVFMGGGKRETHYMGGELHLNQGDEWFWNMFSDAKEGQLVGSASVDYIMDLDAMKHISNHNPKAKYILSTRSPIERMVSAVFWSMRNQVFEVQDINELVSKVIDEYLDNGNTIKYDKLIERGLYGHLLEVLLDSTALENIKVVEFEEVNNNSARVIQSLYKFLGVNASFKPPSTSRKPKGNTYNNFLLELDKRIPRNSFAKKLMGRFGEVFKKLKGSDNVDSILNQENRERLQKIFESDQRKFNEIKRQNPSLFA